MRILPSIAPAFALALVTGALHAQASVNETRDPKQRQDPEFVSFYKTWTHHGSPLVDHLPVVAGVPTPRQFLGYYIGAPKKLTYYDKIIGYYRALAKATPRVKVETIGTSDEGRELVVVWVSSEENIKNLAQNRASLAKLADPRGLSDAQVRGLIETTKPNYHFLGCLHSGETGPCEMLMELVYRLATETSPLVTQIRSNVIVSLSPAAEPDGRDRNVDWFYHGLDMKARYGAADSVAAADSVRADSVRTDSARANRGAPTAAAGRGGRGGRAATTDTVAAAQGRGGGSGGGRGASVEGGLPYWGKYVYHDNNRDINLSQLEMRAIIDWYYTAHPPIIHDLHEAQPLLYTFSGGPPQNPNLDPILFTEMPFFANYELEQLTKFGMPGVYTHAFMDGWSPGYLGAVAYNHNGMMKMYETQSGRDIPADSMADSIMYQTPRGRGGDAFGRGGFGGQSRIPTGKGGDQQREWYRGIALPPNAVNVFTRRDNTNYMETGVLSALQLTSMFPQMVLQNFYLKTKHSIDDGATKAPYAFIVRAAPDMTKPASLVNVLRAQGIEVATLNKATVAGKDTFPAGSFVIKLNQPYGRLAKNLLEKQVFPDPGLTTYDDSGWSMGWAFGVAVKQVDDKSILDAAVTPVKTAAVKGAVAGAGTSGLAVAHLGSNNMIAFRYLLKNVGMKVADAPFTAEGVKFPAGSFIVTGSPADLAAARHAVDSLGLTAAALTALPTVASHDANVPRVAIYSQWSGTQELGWYRYTFDEFHIPYDLIFKERVAQGNLKKDYDVIVMAAQNINRAQVFAKKAKHPQPYEKSDKYKFLGMYGSTPDMSGGFGQAGVDAINAFLDAGGTLITAMQAVRYPIEFGLARSIDAENPAGVVAQKPLVMAKITRTDSPIFYGYASDTIPVKFGQGSQVFRFGVADSSNVLAAYVGGDASVLSGLMTGADNLKNRAFAVDIPKAHEGHGRVIMFANNPIYRWQNHGEFNMIFNSIVNWDDPTPVRTEGASVSATQSGRAGRP
jgi:Zinc carboxypeptidase